jgi:radical SAM family uncharacterized protein
MSTHDLRLTANGSRLTALDTILPLVTKPGRYTGGELNSRSWGTRTEGEGRRAKDEGRLSVALCLPDVYEIGMSNYGLRILYSVLNRRADIICERVYTPWKDMAERMKAAGLPLYALESHRPLKEFDIVGFSLQSELSYTNVLHVLDLAGIPIRSAERGARDPLIIAGGPCCVNPLPMKPFVDCFVIGDGEEAVVEICDAFRDWDHVRRDDLLAILAELDGVYVPQRHDGRTIRRRAVKELKEDDFPFPPILPTCEIVHDRLTIEIARGCTRGCRFCQAGILNRPYRARPVEEVLRIAERGIRASGWEDLSLLSLSSLDYPALLELVRQLNATLEKRRVAVSLPSVRGEDFTPELAAALKQVRKTGLTFAPETGSERLRRFANKEISEERILTSVRNALQAGWFGVKLYFMIGLPGETEEDVREIARLVEAVARVGRGCSVRFNLSPFVPKPHTPLQWEGFEDPASLQEKVRLIRAGLHRRNVKAKWENPEVSCVQTALARGDERVASVVERVYRAGGVFQEWTESFSFALWQQAFVAAGLDMAEFLRPRAGEGGELAHQTKMGTPPVEGDTTRSGVPRKNGSVPIYEAGKQVQSPFSLPWDFIDVGVSKEFLRSERERAYRGELTPDCRSAECQDCGLPSAECLENRGHHQSKGTLLGVVSPGKPVASPFSSESLTPSVDYGRYARKIIDQEQLKSRFRVKYAVGEGFRYAAHLDRVRAFYRGLRRAELPIAYTKGFSPRPVVAFGPPLPLGLTSAAEFLDLQMAGHYPGNLVRDLGPHMPRDLRLLEARPIFSRVESLGAALTAARYQVQTRNVSDQDRATMQERSRTVNGILELHCAEEPSLAGSDRELAPYDRVSVTLGLSLVPGVKLFAALEQLFGRPEPEVRCWRIQRLGCFIYEKGKFLSPMEEL